MNKYQFYSIVFLFNVFILYLYYQELYYIDYIFYGTLSIAFIYFSYFNIVSFYSSFRKNRDLKKLKEVQDLLIQEKQYKQDIDSIYDESFKGSSYQDSFNKKIFTIIDLVSELNEEYLTGVMQARLQLLINKSIKIYIINLKSVAKMIIAQSIDIDFDKEIKELLSKNDIIIDNLKNFVYKIIHLDISENEYLSLIKNFEQSQINLDLIKKNRSL